MCVFSSCKDWVQPKQTCLAPQLPDQSDTLPSSTENLITDIFFDSTLSMQGFVTPGSLSYYQKTIELLERPIINNGGKVNFFKFGTSIKELPDRTYREADKSAFYLDTEINTKTNIETVIEKADTSHLTVIITDLYQEKADIALLNKLIKEKFITNNLAVGVLGIKSQFSGKVYDVGTNNYSFDYKTNGDPLTNRPFYVMAFGKHSDIARYFNSLFSKEMAEFPSKQIFIASRYVTDTLPNSVETGKKIGLNTSSGSIITGAGAKPVLLELKVPDSTESASVQTKLTFNRLSEISVFDQYKPLVKKCSCRNTESDQNNNDSALEISDFSSETITASNKEQLSFNIKIKSSKLDKKQPVNCFHITIHPLIQSLPNWVGEWNIGSEETETANRNQQFDGSRTYNLGPFLQTILNTTVSANNPKLADFYCYVKQS